MYQYVSNFFLELIEGNVHSNEAAKAAAEKNKAKEAEKNKAKAAENKAKEAEQKSEEEKAKKVINQPRSA